MRIKEVAPRSLFIFFLPWHCSKAGGVGAGRMVSLKNVMEQEKLLISLNLE